MKLEIIILRAHRTDNIITIIITTTKTMKRMNTVTLPDRARGLLGIAVVTDENIDRDLWLWLWDMGMNGKIPRVEES